MVQGPDLLGELLEQLVGRGEERVQQVVDSLLLQANGFSSIVAKVSGLLELNPLTHGGKITRAMGTKVG